MAYVFEAKPRTSSRTLVDEKNGALNSCTYVIRMIRIAAATVTITGVLR